ncbi:MAG: General stress protein 69 [Bacteroidota bacterium]|nr:MAG: General stress protein 69 [Bacteroidota bacterium]
MKYTTIPHTDIRVSKICLGTMTWGNQNTQEEAFEQMDYALDKGVNFFDTAELYPVPANADTYADTERIIGRWFAQRNKRDKVVLATKIAGPGAYTAHIRTTGFSPDSLREALEGSLTRLKTDYIDVYQLHWPERKANFFGKRDYYPDTDDQWEENFESVLETLDAFVQEGKIRHIGLSNETPWGTMKYLNLSENKNLPRAKTIQNPYSLLNRTFEVGNAEVSHREQLGLLAYSPLAFGVLSGKYRNEHLPENSRLKLFPRMKRYSSVEASAAVEAYAKIAEKHQLSLTQLALAFVTDRLFVTSNIIGATTMPQLEENIATAAITLSDEILAEIDAVHNRMPNPAP